MKLYCTLVALILLNAYPAYASPSICYGTTSKGKLLNAVSLPQLGRNYVTYSNLLSTLGRTHVHSKVAEVLLLSFQMLEKEQPGRTYKYGETGTAEGGPFKPHKTHQNGLSVDLMVPVRDLKGKPLPLPTHAFNKYGYNVKFSRSGKHADYSLDFEALAAQIYTLDLAAKKKGVKIWRVIFDPKMQKYLFATKYGPYLKRNIRFSKRPSWVRHDDHIHVDFQVRCKKYTAYPKS